MILKQQRKPLRASTRLKPIHWSRSNPATRREMVPNTVSTPSFSLTPPCVILKSSIRLVMENITEAAFLQWAGERGMGLDEKYPDSAVLSYDPDLEQDRFWEVPLEPERRPYFIHLMLSLLGNWSTCYVWRHLGSWPNAADPRRINDQIELQILTSIGLPLGTGDVVVFSRDEINQLITLIFSTTIFGWSVGDDLYIVPDNAKYILQTDHHGVIHVSFKSADDVAPFVAKMNECDFPLPDDVPDETFKRPKWLDDK